VARLEELIQWTIRTALQYGGRTIAVFGCGVDVVYPAENIRLYHEIADGHGAVISEFPLR